jgi:hypothetical protein
MAKQFTAVWAICLKTISQIPLNTGTLPTTLMLVLLMAILKLLGKGIGTGWFDSVFRGGSQLRLILMVEEEE